VIGVQQRIMAAVLSLRMIEAHLHGADPPDPASS